MNRIKLSGTRNIILLEPFEPDANSDYLLSLRVAPLTTEIPVKQGEEEPDKTYKLKVIQPEGFMKVGGSQIKVRKGFTPSQVQRALIFDYLRRIGKEETEENYEKIMGKIAATIEKWGT